MATRSTKAKKAASVKVAENEAPKKGRSKTKIAEEAESETMELDVNEKATVPEKRAKRAKKMTNTDEVEQTNGTTEDTVPTVKKSRKKVAEEADEPKQILNDDNDSVDAEDGQNGDHADVNGHSQEIQSTSGGKGRKKQLKKETEKPKDSGRARKKNEIVDSELAKDSSEKLEPVAKGRGRKPQSKEKGSETTEKAEEEKIEATTRGRKKEQKQKKGQTKEAKIDKEKTPDSDESHEDKKIEEKPVEEPKKENKNKGRGKKMQAKEVTEESDEEFKEEEPVAKKRKITKKEEKSSGESKDEELEDEEPEVKPSKGRRGQKKPVETPIETDEEPEDAGDSTAKRRRKPVEEKAPPEDAKKKPPPKNKATTNYEGIDFSNSSMNTQGKEWNFKIASWNVDGIRAWLGKGGLDYIKYEKPDILCLQEVKCAQDKLPEEVANVPGYHAYWLCSDKDGYAGVGIYTTKLAMNVQYGLQNEELDNEGRIITAEYEQFYLVCTYVPNAGRKLVTLPKRLQWNEEFRKHIKELDAKKPVIICGDMNVAHNEIDLTNPKTNRKNAGFTDEERAGMTELLGDGFVDTYRRLNPDATGAYTFWTYMMNSRARNVGWRLDYFIVSERLLTSVCDSVIRSEVYGSDHCPISLLLHLTSADKPKE